MARLLLRLLLPGLVGTASSACTDEVSCSRAVGTEEASLLASHAKTQIARSTTTTTTAVWDYTIVPYGGRSDPDVRILCPFLRMINPNKTHDAESFIQITTHFGFAPDIAGPFNALVAGNQGLPKGSAVDIYKLAEAGGTSHPDLYFLHFDEVKKETEARAKNGWVTYQDLVDIKVKVVAKAAGILPCNIDSQSKAETQFSYLRSGGNSLNFTSPPYQTNASEWLRFIQGYAVETGYAIGLESNASITYHTFSDDDTRFWENASQYWPPECDKNTSLAQSQVQTRQHKGAAAAAHMIGGRRSGTLRAHSPNVMQDDDIGGFIQHSLYATMSKPEFTSEIDGNGAHHPNAVGQGEL